MYILKIYNADLFINFIFVLAKFYSQTFTPSNFSLELETNVVGLTKLLPKGKGSCLESTPSFQYLNWSLLWSSAKAPIGLLWPNLGPACR